MEFLPNEFTEVFVLFQYIFRKKKMRSQIKISSFSIRADLRDSFELNCWSSVLFFFNIHSKSQSEVEIARLP